MVGRQNTPSAQSLQAQLTLRERELELVMAIDHVRDAIVEPPAMLAGIADLLVHRFQTDLCLLCLLHRETGDLELKAVHSRGERLGGLEIDSLRQLARRATQADDVTLWQARDVLPAGVAFPANPHLAGVPIIMGADERLGALLLVRVEPPFSPDEVRLLGTAESQIDSAVIQGYAHYDLQQRNKELETIYRVDRIRDLHLPFDEMLTAVLQQLRTAVEAEAGFIMLYDACGGHLSLRATTDDDLFRADPHAALVEQVADQALGEAGMVCRNDLGGDLESILCIPLILNEEIIGVLGVVNRYGPRGFGVEDRRLISAIASQMDTAIFETIERRRLRQVLGRSVDPQVMNRLLASPDIDFLKGERSMVSVLYSDVRGSTTLAEQVDPEQLVEFVNDTLGRMTEMIISHQGTLDKFLGDGVMALFGAPFSQSDHALRAVRTGLEIQETHRAVMAAWQGRDLTAAPIGVGIATGELIAGEIGCARRTDYTVIGRAANLGARICGVAQPGQVLICPQTYALIEERVEATPITGLQLKGIAQDVTVYDVVRLLD